MKAAVLASIAGVAALVSLQRALPFAAPLSNTSKRGLAHPRTSASPTTGLAAGHAASVPGRGTSTGFSTGGSLGLVASCLLCAAGARLLRSAKGCGAGSAGRSLAVQLCAHAAGIKIIGTGSCAPKTCVTNDDLTDILDTNDEWISQRTGIRRRHVLGPDESLESISAEAAKRALEKANIPAEDIGLVILATSTPDDLFGSATEIAAQLGAKNAVAFDMTAACSGFVFAMVTASQFFRSGSVKNAVIIGADCLARWVDWTDRGTCVLFGDGAGAVVIQATKPEDDCLLGFELGSDGTGKCNLGLPSKATPIDLGGGHTGSLGAYGTIGMNGKEVFRFATTRVPEVLSRLMAENNVTNDDIDWLLLHQANRRIMDSAAKRLKLSQDRILCNLDEYGNTSAGSIPLMLDEAVRDGRVKPGQLVACMGFGAGLSWGGMLIRA